ncbi:MAG: hypothetical protein ABIU77_27725 [Ferruginibacter sp.]
MEYPKSFGDFYRLRTKQQIEFIESIPANRERPMGVFSDAEIDLLVTWGRYNGVVRILNVERLSDARKRLLRKNLAESATQRKN